MKCKMFSAYGMDRIVSNRYVLFTPLSLPTFLKFRVLQNRYAILDSGAFSVAKEDFNIDIRQYAEVIRYTRKLLGRRLLFAFNLDVIPYELDIQKAIEESLRNHSFLASNCDGVAIAGVYHHIYEPLEFFEQLCRECRVVGITTPSPRAFLGEPIRAYQRMTGKSIREIQQELQEKLKGMREIILATRKKKKLWVHILGSSRNSFTYYLKANSCDIVVHKRGGVLHRTGSKNTYPLLRSFASEYYQKLFPPELLL